MNKLTSAQALNILRAAGHVAVQKGALPGMCRTLCYRVDGKPVNLGRLRQLAAEAQAGPELLADMLSGNR